VTTEIKSALSNGQEEGGYHRGQDDCFRIILPYKTTTPNSPPLWERGLISSFVSNKGRLHRIRYEFRMA